MTISFSSRVIAIEAKGEWSCHFIAKQLIVQLYFEWKITKGRIPKVLEGEGLKVFKKTVWSTVSMDKAHRTLSRLPQRVAFSAEIHQSLPISFSSEVDLALSLRRLPSIDATLS